MDNIKLKLINILDEIYQGNFSNVEINSFFEKNDINKKEKGFVTNTVNIVLKNELLLEYFLSKVTKNIKKRKIKILLKISLAQFLFSSNDAEGIVYEAIEITKIINKHQAGFVNATLNEIIKNKDKFINEMPEEKKESILFSYPQWIVNKFKIDYPNDYLEILKSYKERAFLSVRINPKKLGKDEFKNLMQESKTAILFEVGDVFYLDNSNVFLTDEFKNGNIIVQDASSYISALNYDIKETDIVLDACAAPGGKTLAALQIYNPKSLIATDISKEKISLLQKRLDKYKFSNLKTIQNDATKIEELNTKFDKIILDVPCSGLGVLRKKPEKIYTLSLNDIKALKKIQMNILISAYNSLKDGGEIIYSTCTITPNENTNNIHTILNKFEDLKIVPVEIPENVEYEKDEYGGAYISYKNKYLDGFYIAKLKKM